MYTLALKKYGPDLNADPSLIFISFSANSQVPFALGRLLPS